MQYWCPYFFFISLVYFLHSKALTKNCPNILKAFEELRRKKVLFCLISCLKINVINFIYVIKCFHSNAIILITIKNHLNLIFYNVFFAISNFRVFLEIIPLSDIFQYFLESCLEHIKNSCLNKVKAF